MASIVLSTMFGCGEANTATHSRTLSSIESGIGGEQNATKHIHAGTEQHVTASGKVFDVMMEDLSHDTIQSWAVALLPESPQQDQQEFAEQLSQVLSSAGFRREYCEILMEMFSEEECERLAEILSDPVLKKFQKRKVEYFSRMVSLAEKYLENSTVEPGDGK